MTLRDLSCFPGRAANDNGWSWSSLALRARLMARHPGVVRRMGLGRLPWSGA